MPDTPDTEVPLLKGILTNLGGATLPDTEVPILRAIVDTYGVSVLNTPDTEVPLLKAWLGALGGNVATGGDTEVPLLKSIYLQLGGVAADMGDTEVPLLTQILALTGSGPPVPTVPDAPTIGVAVATGNTTASVPFTAPVSDGGSTILSYTATSTPGGITGTLVQAGSGTILMTGLSNSTQYTFKVHATNAVGNSSESAASNAVDTFYPFTAFVSSTGDDTTAVIGDITKPFQTINGSATCAANALATVGIHVVTIRLLDNCATGYDVSADLTLITIDALLGNGLIIRSHDATVRTFGDSSFGSQANAILTLIKATCGTLIKELHVGPTVESAGTITGDADSVIGILDVSALTTAPAPGGNGNNGSDSTGSPNCNACAAPSAGSPPTPGFSGGSADSSGDIGGLGGAGNRAWNVTLLGSFLVSALSGVGGDASVGGNGGSGAIATGGGGQPGGDSDAIVLEDGAAGGDGGNAISNGGNGGDGGVGGDASTISKNVGVSITISTLTGGNGGAGGIGNSAGTANAGSGGVGGAGAAGGNQGPSGANGTSTANPGVAGSTGAAGANGSINIV